MAQENDLEKRAIEELLRETDRARVRAETMGPAGWLKCPLQSTNKRFLLNTLRSTGSQQRTSSEPRARYSETSSLLRSKVHDRKLDRSRSPPRDGRGDSGHTDHKKHHHRDSTRNKDKKEDRCKERSHRHGDKRDRRHGKDGQNGHRPHE
ncbi:hypothetical protein JOB18_027433 [Solea senegalensis]|uniref:Uncharacterized protein n=2 Tax=Solea senegalensis TaxID=28829 RepID=A0AAV6T841_SOLSE|nr:protein POLR1D-like [Solea senegalensis]KAG7525484.1 hypothetical protein JOB18_027433 [Solea senegalensis]